MTSSGEELPSDEMDDELPPLLQAAKIADVAAFKKMMEDGEDVLQKDEDERTVLHWAAQSGCVAIMMAGLARGLMWHVDSKSKRGLTPLHEACLAGSVRTVHVLLSIGANMTSQTQEGYTPLLCAAGNGHDDVTRVLVGAGCDPNQLLPMIGVNALHIAAWTDQPDVLEDLLKMGGDINRKSRMGKTAMDFALEQNHTDCVSALRRHEEKMQKSFEQKLTEQEGFFRTKLNLLADKIHKYYDDRLKQEIEYFEQQLQEQHDRDNGIIAKLKNRIDKLLRTELDDEEGDDEGKMDESGGSGRNEEMEERDDEEKDVVGMGLLKPVVGNSKMALRRRRRSSQFAHRPRMFSITGPAPSGVGDHDSSDDEHAHGVRRRFDRQIGVLEGPPPDRRPGSAKGKSMIELVDDVSKRRSSVNFVRGSSYSETGRSESGMDNHASMKSPPEHGVPVLRLLQPTVPPQTHSNKTSTTSSMSTSVTPSNSSFSPSPPHSSMPHGDLPGSVRSMSPSQSTDSVFMEENNNNNRLKSPAPPSKTKSRRSSIAAFLRPHFKSAPNEEQRSRRRSVETKIPAPKAPAPQPTNPRKKGFSLFSIPLPGIPVEMIQEEARRNSSEDVEMLEGSGSH